MRGGFGGSEAMREFPRTDRGYFHLTPHGWMRQDLPPFPADRAETWRYELECPAPDAKERVCLTKIWSRPDLSAEGLAALQSRYGEPLLPTPDRNVTLECSVR